MDKKERERMLKARADRDEEIDPEILKSKISNNIESEIDYIKSDIKAENRGQAVLDDTWIPEIDHAGKDS